MTPQTTAQNDTEHLLWDEMEAYVAKGLYPMHMPGHKRLVNPAPHLPGAFDLTEVEGVDDLHHAEGILREAMERTAALFGARRTWYLVNGSTVGLLAAMRAVCGFGTEVIIARNCHKAVYHAVELLHLRVRWIYPEWIPSLGIYGSVRPDSVEEALSDCPNAKAVILTSPTYEGVVSDIKAIAEAAHQREIPLIVDEAHGAHLGLFPEAGFVDSAVHLGADLIIQSAHKTLPSLTQTALLHLGSCGIWKDEAAIERELDVFETSSPSYPLLVSLDGCTGILRERGRELFGGWRAALKAFDLLTRNLICLRVFRHGAEAAPDNQPDGAAVFAYDSGKILVSGNGFCTGGELSRLLREKYAIETEMHLGGNVLAMTSCADSKEGILALGKALMQIDESLRQKAPKARSSLDLALNKTKPAVMTIADAVAARTGEISLGEAEGCVSGEYVYCYPPGIPVIVPGERITRDEQKRIRYDMEQGCRIFHSKTSQYAEADTDPDAQPMTIVIQE